jgi:hypothetical protein
MTRHLRSTLLGHSSSSLQDSIQLLDQSAKITSSQAQQARVLAGSRIHRNSLDIIEIYSLCRIASEVTEVTRILDDTANTAEAAIGGVIETIDSTINRTLFFVAKWSP